MSDWSDEKTDDPLHADRRNFYKVEKWSRECGSSYGRDEARCVFERTTKHRPRIKKTDAGSKQWPQSS